MQSVKIREICIRTLYATQEKVDYLVIREVSAIYAIRRSEKRGGSVLLSNEVLYVIQMLHSLWDGSSHKER